MNSVKKAAFRKFKNKFPGCIRFLQRDDFYECFFEDASTCSRVLDLPLEKRGKGKDSIPLVEIPNYILKFYLKKLSANGFKVCVFEKHNVKTEVGVVIERDVVRTIWPGARSDGMTKGVEHGQC